MLLDYSFIGIFISNSENILCTLYVQVTKFILNVKGKNYVSHIVALLFAVFVNNYKNCARDFSIFNNTFASNNVEVSQQKSKSSIAQNKKILTLFNLSRITWCALCSPERPLVFIQCEVLLHFL